MISYKRYRTRLQIYGNISVDKQKGSLFRKRFMHHITVVPQQIYKYSNLIYCYKTRHVHKYTHVWFYNL